MAANLDGWHYLPTIGLRIRYDPREKNFITHNGQRLPVQLAQSIIARDSINAVEGKGRDVARVQEVEASEEEEDEEEEEDDDERALQRGSKQDPDHGGRNPRQSPQRQVGKSGATAEIWARHGNVDIRNGNVSPFTYAPTYNIFAVPSNPDTGNQSRNQPDTSQKDSNKAGKQT
ncbi:hypothetical protein LTR95_004801 [Oleoguttula sp. CCFEE 5521]